MPAKYTTIGYCDEQEVENYLLLDIDESFADQINDWIATAESQVNKFLGYTTASGVLAETIVGETSYGLVDTDGNLMIFPQKVPIHSIQGISLKLGADSFDVDIESGGIAKYNIPNGSDHILFPSSEISGTGTLTSFYGLRQTKFFTDLDYVGGYMQIPADIKQATINLVADIVMRHTNKEGLESITQGRVTKRFWARTDGHSDFYLDAMELLKPYRIASRWIA